LVTSENGIAEEMLAEQVNDVGKGCCWLEEHGESISDGIYLWHDEHRTQCKQLSILQVLHRAMVID